MDTSPTFLISLPDENGSTSGASTTKHLAALISAWVGALNARDLDPQASVFQNVDPHFAAVPGIGGSPSAPKSLTFPDYLAHMRGVVAQNPEFQMRVLDFDTNVHLRSGTAQVFVNYEVSGAPVGLSRRALAIFRFPMMCVKCGDDGHGMWRLFTFQVIEGMEPGGG